MRSGTANAVPAPRARARTRPALVVVLAVLALALLTVAPAAADTPTTAPAPPSTTPTTQPLGGLLDQLDPSGSSTTATTTPATTSTSSSTTTAPAPPVSLPASSFTTKEPAPTRRATPIADPLFAARAVADRLQAQLATLTAQVQAADKANTEAASAAARADREVNAAVAAQRAAVRDIAAAHKRLAGDAVAAYVNGGQSPGGALTTGDTAMSSRTYLSSLITQHEAQLAQAKADQVAAANRHAAAVSAADAAHTKATAAAAAAKASHDQLHALNVQLLSAVHRLDAADAASKPLTLDQIAALLASYEARLAGDGTAPPLDPRAAAAVKYALAQVGKPYVWGGNGPNSYDCSGLTQESWLHGGGVRIPRVAADQQGWTVPVAMTAAQPGDLVFFGLPAFHVGLYLGNGMMVDAPHQGAYVRVEPIWRESFSGFGRVV